MTQQRMPLLQKEQAVKPQGLSSKGTQTAIVLRIWALYCTCSSNPLGSKLHGLLQNPSWKVKASIAMAKIENYKYSIAEAFRDCFYIVPDYQREYVWTDKEVHQLLEDINEQIDAGSGREYFIGTVLVSPAAEKNHFEVIDGQQRLTTFFLLLCGLKQLFRGEPKYRF